MGTGGLKNDYKYHQLQDYVRGGGQKVMIEIIMSENDGPTLK